MNTKQFKEDVRATKTTQELCEKAETLQRDLFTLRLKSLTSPVKDNTQFKKYRKNIACILTEINNRNRTK